MSLCEFFHCYRILVDDGLSNRFLHRREWDHCPVLQTVGDSNLPANPSVNKDADNWTCPSCMGERKPAVRFARYRAGP